MSILERYKHWWVLDPKTECYIWTGRTFNTGRPSVTRNYVNYNVARLVCEEAHGPSPTPEHEAAHATSNGCVGVACINPAHIRWATHDENIAESKSSALPKYVYRHGDGGFIVRFKGKHIGIFSTLDEAIKAVPYTTY